MTKSILKRTSRISTAFLITISSLLLAASPSVALQKIPEETYAPILGQYEFDMSSFGWGIVKIRFFVENGTLWTQTDMSSSPEEMIRIDDDAFEFMIDDPDEGRYDILFPKDDAGNHTQCRIKNSSQDMDVVGKKIAQQPTS